MTKNPLGIAWPLRAWFAAEVFFGVAAIVSIARDPANTATNFAWSIQPTVMAAVIGAFYLALTPTLLLALFAKRWDMVRVIIIPGILFTAAELVTTLLHWGRFSVGTMPFNVWFASYLLPPPIFLACYIWHQRRTPPSRIDEPLARWLRIALIVLGSLLSIEAIVAFIWPQWFASSFPWQLTPLTTRALCGWVLALGAMMLSMAHENDRARMRIASPFLILPLPMLAMQIARFPDQVNWQHPRIYSGLILFGIIMALGVYLVRGDWHRTLR